MPLGNMAGIERYFRIPLTAVLAVSLFAMMALVFADVLGRYFLDSPIRGSYELTQTLMAIVVFSGFPLVTQSREHITVAILQNLGGKWASTLRGIGIDLVSAVVVGFMALRLWDQAVSLGKSGYVIGLVAIPMAPFAYFMCVMSLAAAAVCFVHAGNAFKDLFLSRS